MEFIDTNLKILIDAYNKYVEENPIKSYAKPNRESYLQEACKKIKWALSHTDIDGNSEFYLNAEEYIKDLFNSEMYFNIYQAQQRLAIQRRNEAIEQEDKIFQEKMASLNK